MSLSLLAAAREVSGRPALVASGRVHTYGGLAEEVRRAAAELSRPGARAPARVALEADLSVETLVRFYALLELGTEIALLDPRWGEAERERTLARLRPELVLAAGRDRPLPGAGADQAGPSPSPEGVDLERCQVIVQTSGTSGRSKGVMLGRRALVAAARASEANLGWREDDRWLLALPPAHVGGLSILTRCLLGRSTVVLEPAGRFEPAAFAEAVARRRVTLLSLVPTMLRRLLALHPAWCPPGHLRAMLVGGAVAPAELLAEADERGWPVLATYGLTEASSQVATQLYGSRQRGELGCGPPLPGLELRIRRGRIELRGPTLLTAYLGPAGEERPFPPGGWFRTGDLGRLDERGNLHVLGRADSVIVSGGENVHPEEVEAVLEAHPAVAGAAVFPHPDPEWGQAVAAVLEVSPDSDPALEAELLAFCRRRLASYQVPKHLVWLEALPRTSAGKKLRSRAAELARPFLP